MALSVALSARQPEVYRAEASVQLRDVSEDVVLTGRGNVTPTNLVVEASQTASRIDSAPVAAAVKRRLRSPLTIAELRSKVTGQVEVTTNLVVAVVEDESARGAKTLADAYAQQTVDEINSSLRRRLADAERSLRVELRASTRRLNNEDSNTTSSDTVTNTVYRQEIARLQSLQRFSRGADIIAAADLPKTPVSPKPVRNAIIALVLGLIAGLGYAFARNALDRRLRGADEVQRELDYPLLGLLSDDGLGGVPLGDPGSRVMPAPDVEAARIIRTNLQYLDIDNAPKVVAVTSALPAEGKSTIAAALAISSALTGRLTLLIECDLRRPSLSDRLGVHRSPGLTDYLAGNAKPEEILQVRPLQEDGGTGAALVCIAAGSPVPRPAELLGSKMLQQLLEELRDSYDLVVLDTSPMLPVVDTLALLPHVDAITICARSDQTTREQARALRTALSNLPPKPTGLVVTGVKRNTDQTYSYYSYAYADAT